MHKYAIRMLHNISSILWAFLHELSYICQNTVYIQIIFIIDAYISLPKPAVPLAPPGELPRPFDEELCAQKLRGRQTEARGGFPPRAFGSHHLFRPHCLVKLLGRQQPQGYHRLFQRGPLPQSLFGTVGRRLIADFRRQAGHQHQRVAEVLLYPLHIGHDALYAVDPEGLHSVCQQPGGEEKIIRAHRQKHVELEISLAGGKADGRVGTHHLHRHHGHRLALGRVHLPRHDGRARLVFRDA